MAKANQVHRNRPRHPDVAVSEVISYVFMLALGAVALTISMSVLTTTQEDGEDITLSIQMKQAGQIVVANLQETARIATLSPNASYNMTFEVPEPVGDRSYNATITPNIAGQTCEARNLTVTAITDLGQVRVNVSLGNAGQTQIDNPCLFENGLALDGSTPLWRLQYRNDIGAAPQITIHPDR